MNFEMNKHGVITNPEKIQIIDKCYVKLAEWKGRWYYAYDITLKDYGGMSPVTATAWDFCSKNKQVVLRYALLRIKKTHENRSYSGVQKLIEGINKMLYSRQLTLF